MADLELQPGDWFVLAKKSLKALGENISPNWSRRELTFNNTLHFLEEYKRAFIKKYDPDYKETEDVG